MNISKDKSQKLVLQIENLDKAIFEYFNKQNPIFIINSENQEIQIPVKLNVGETWEQIVEAEKKQIAGDFILKKPIVTINPTGIEPIKEWNRNSALKILIDKQIYKNPKSGDIDYIPNKNSVPVFEYTYMSYPTHFLRGYRLYIWADYITDQNRILESIITELISSNTIIIENSNYKTVGYLRNITDDTNFNNRSETYRDIKNYIDLEFEGYLVNAKSIFKKRSASHFRITESIVKEFS